MYYADCVDGTKLSADCFAALIPVALLHSVIPYSVNSLATFLKPQTN